MVNLFVVVILTFSLPVWSSLIVERTVTNDVAAIAAIHPPLESLVIFVWLNKYNI